MNRLALLALLFVAPATAEAASSFTATITRVSPGKAAPTSPVSSGALAPLPGTVVSDRGPMIVPVAVGGTKGVAAVPVPENRPEALPASGGWCLNDV
jgi:hypothetical protein